MTLLLLTFTFTPMVPLVLAMLSVARSLLEQCKRPVGTLVLAPVAASMRQNSSHGV
jgi:hypothetical protein